MASVAVEGPLGADGPGLKKHPGGLHVASEAGIIESDGVPTVPGVDVDDEAGVEEVAEAVDVAGAGGLEDVAGGDFL